MPNLSIKDVPEPLAEALRLRAERLCVISRGKIVAERPKRDTVLTLPGRPSSINRRHKA